MSKNEFSFESAKALLDYLVNKKEFIIKAPVDIVKIVSDLGIKLVEDNTLDKDGIVGQILFDDNEQTIIKINPLQNWHEPRRRFTIAHELGHYCLHKTSSKPCFSDSRKSMSRSSSYWDNFEFEANNFAAQLLMPQDIILDEGIKIINRFKQTNPHEKISANCFTEALADKFMVSNTAMGYRLKNLGIIS